MPTNISLREYNAHTKQMTINTKDIMHKLMAVVLTAVFSVLLFSKTFHYHEDSSCSHHCSQTEKCDSDCDICKLTATLFIFHTLEEVKLFVKAVETEYKDFVCDVVICSNEVTSLRAPPQRA